MTTVNDQPAGREPHDYSRDPYGVNDGFADGGDTDPIYFDEGEYESDERKAVAEMTGPAVSVAARTAPYDVRLKLGTLLVEHRGGDGNNTADVIDRILAVLDVPADVPPRAEPELEVRVHNTMFEHAEGFTSARMGTRQIIRVVREASPRAYSDRVTLPAEHVESGWQVLDARDEETWRDVTEVVDCADPNCTSTAGIGDPDVSCIVLVGAAWAEGYTHLPTSDHIDVRIPAATA